MKPEPFVYKSTTLNALPESFETPTYKAYELTRSDRESLLSKFPTTHSRVIADHISAESLNHMDAVKEGAARGEVIGISDDNGMQSLVVTVNGRALTSDGTPFHISWSADPGVSSGRAGILIKENGYRKLSSPIPLDLSAGITINMPLRESSRDANETDKEFATRVVSTNFS